MPSPSLKIGLNCLDVAVVRTSLTGRVVFRTFCINAPLRTRWFLYRPYAVRPPPRCGRARPSPGSHDASGRLGNVLDMRNDSDDMSDAPTAPAWNCLINVGRVQAFDFLPVGEPSASGFPERQARAIRLTSLECRIVSSLPIAHRRAAGLGALDACPSTPRLAHHTMMYRMPQQADLAPFGIPIAADAGYCGRLDAAPFRTGVSAVSRFFRIA